MPHCDVRLGCVSERLRGVSERLRGVQFNCCKSHRPRKKGINEITNCLIREFFPKGIDFSKVSEYEVQHVFSMINDRSRKGSEV